MDTLYVRIGNENLQKLIDQFYDLVFSSEKIAPLFKNDKEQCLVNAKERKNKNVDNTIENYSKVYNLDNYKNYNYKILDVFK